MQKTTKRPTKRSRARGEASVSELVRPSLITELELARLGDGQVAYIKAMTSAQARRMFPSIKGLPRGIDLYALHAADGTPIALTDSRQAAVGHAIDG
ncbi:MAG: DUF1150 domain-containing protein, partial [Proteobacteria bacterium]|nr:DUF1150 domain-containing protein [Pseudomonadota bacterium]